MRMRLTQHARMSSKDRHQLQMMAPIATQQLHSKTWLLIEAHSKTLREHLLNELGPDNLRDVEVPFCTRHQAPTITPAHQNRDWRIDKRTNTIGTQHVQLQCSDV